jgi:hypothetical protein
MTNLKIVEKVTVLQTVTTLDIPTERVLNAALNTVLTGAIVIGVDAEGELYFSSSFADGGSVLWWMEKAKKALLEVQA